MLVLLLLIAAAAAVEVTREEETVERWALRPLAVLRNQQDQSISFAASYNVLGNCIALLAKNS